MADEGILYPVLPRLLRNLMVSVGRWFLKKLIIYYGLKKIIICRFVIIKKMFVVGAVVGSIRRQEAKGTHGTLLDLK